MISQLQLINYMKGWFARFLADLAECLSVSISAMIFILLLIMHLTLSNQGNIPLERGTKGWFLGCAFLQLELDLAKPEQHPKIIARTTIDCSVRKDST